MGPVKNDVPSTGKLGTYQPADESLSAKTALQPALSSTTNVCGSLSSIGKAGATQKRAKTIVQKIISLLKKGLLDRAAYIGKSSPVPTRFNLRAITRSTPGDLASLEAKANIHKLREECRLVQHEFKDLDSQSKELNAFGKMCEIHDTVQSCLKEARKLKGSLGAVHSNVIDLDTLIEEYESFGQCLDSERRANFQNNQGISQAHIQRTWKDINSTIKKTNELADIPSPGVAKNMGFSSVNDAKLRLSEELASALKNIDEQLYTVDNNPGIHHISIRPQLQKMTGFIKAAIEVLTFDTRQQNRQEYLEHKDAKSSLKKYAPFKNASVGERSMPGKKVAPLQSTEIKRHEPLEKTDLGPMLDTVSLSPPIVR